MTTIDETAMQHTISRRSFVKGASALAAGGALRAQLTPMPLSRNATRTATCAIRFPSAA